jgi:pimeloyl-ACP methyl ester carboxylesterase
VSGFLGLAAVSETASAVDSALAKQRLDRTDESTMNKSSASDIRSQQRVRLAQESSAILSRGPSERGRRPLMPYPTTRNKKTNSSVGPSSWLGPALIGSAALLGAAAIYNTKLARDAEAKYPPIGRFLEVNGVRLHYIDRGQGEPVVLIHGNGTMLQDFTVSGMVDHLSARHRVIVFDRPGYGYSDRPRRLWTPRAQAKVLEKALQQMGIHQAVVLGHSWGSLVAVALALQAPFLVRSLVLASGYYYPTVRADVFLQSPPAIPLLGDVMRYTVSPPLARLMLPRMIRRAFEPAPVPKQFDSLFPKELMVRPSQLRAAAEDSALMIPGAVDLQDHYRDLAMPVIIIAGEDDQIADVGRQSRRLNGELPGSKFILLPGLGHMIHHSAPADLIRAIEFTAH